MILLAIRVLSTAQNLQLSTRICLQRLRNQLFMCKHLIQIIPCPRQLKVTIKRNASFIVIERCKTRVCANIDDGEVWVHKISEKKHPSLSTEKLARSWQLLIEMSWIVSLRNEISRTLRDALHCIEDLKQNTPELSQLANFTFSLYLQKKKIQEWCAKLTKLKAQPTVLSK